MTKVIKIGGAALTSDAWLRAFAAAAAEMTEPCVIVHGGGPEISAVSVALGIEPQWQNGRRVTPADALDAAAMVLNGRVNKRVVAALLSAGVDAAGLSGIDGGLLRASVAEGGALGRVGVIQQVRSELIELFLERGMTPVISPISLGGDGGALNVNADDAACAIARAINVDEMLFLTDVDGVLAGGAVIDSLGVTDARRMIESGVAYGGMAVKLESAAAAVEAGIEHARIGGLAMLTDSAAGTAVSALAEVLQG